MVLFAPTQEQLVHAEKERAKSDKDLKSFPCCDLIKAQEIDPSIAIISKEESDNLPFIPGLRDRFFVTLPKEIQKTVLRANIAGLNLTATGENGETFVYMAPETELERTRMITELNQLDAAQKNTQVLGKSITKEPTQEVDISPIRINQGRQD